jgi:dihydroflavonol-4-reductase
MAKVLVTGGSGFIGSYCILQLLEAGHEVRTTVRSLAS